MRLFAQADTLAHVRAPSKYPASGLQLCFSSILEQLIERGQAMSGHSFIGAVFAVAAIHVASFLLEKHSASRQAVSLLNKVKDGVSRFRTKTAKQSSIAELDSALLSHMSTEIDHIQTEHSDLIVMQSSTSFLWSLLPAQSQAHAASVLLSRLERLEVKLDVSQHVSVQIESIHNRLDDLMFDMMDELSRTMQEHSRRSVSQIHRHLDESALQASSTHAELGREEGTTQKTDSFADSQPPEAVVQGDNKSEPRNSFTQNLDHSDDEKAKSSPSSSPSINSYFPLQVPLELPDFEYEEDERSSDNQIFGTDPVSPDADLKDFFEKQTEATNLSDVPNPIEEVAESRALLNDNRIFEPNEIETLPRDDAELDGADFDICDIDFEKYSARELHDLGEKYHKGIGVAADPEKAVKYFQISAERGCEDGKAGMACCYLEGLGVAQDTKKAVEIFTELSRAGNAKAQMGLGVCYDRGEGVEQDVKKAVALYRRAANAGYAPAICNLASCYELGKGTTRSISKAITLYQVAVSAGNSNALLNLGYCYDKGIGVEEDQTKAAQLYTQAADNGNTSAQAILGFCYVYGRGVDIDRQRGVELLATAGLAGNVWAQYQLGLVLQKGMGVEPDAEKAAALFAQAAKSGYEQARLAYIALTGQIVDLEFA